jgi:hypothetical protein
MKVHFIAVSQNAKSGPIPVTIIERASCWPGCALYGNGCYAETGALALHGIEYPGLGRRVLVGVLRKDRSASAWPSLALCPSRRPPRIRGRDRRRAPGPARHRQHRQERNPPSPTNPSSATILSLSKTGASSLRAVEPGFTVNLSADNPADADRLAELLGQLQQANLGPDHLAFCGHRSAPR